MSAICECGWTGASTKVRDGGRCPACLDKVRYESAPLESKALSLREFNRRAAIALNAVSFGAFNRSEDVAKAFAHQVAAGSVSEKMQQAIFNICNRYRQQITDQQVIEYATMRARGADA